MFIERFFTDLIRLSLTLTLLGALGTLILTLQLTCDPHAAAAAYHSVGLMAEHVLAGCICCLACGLIRTKIHKSLHD